MQNIFGVTGGFGAGKTTFCRFLEKSGAHFINTDALTHELYKPGKAGYEKIKGYFGVEFVDAKKGVKKSLLRRVVLKNPQKLWILNKLIHPLITQEVNKKIVQIRKRSPKPIFVEAFYLEKDDLGSLIDDVILIERDPKLIFRARKKEARFQAEEIRRFMRLQHIAPLPKWTITNNGTLDAFKRRAFALYATIMKEYGGI